MHHDDARQYADKRGLLLERHEHFTEAQPGVWIAEGATPPASVTLRGDGSTVWIGTGADCTGATISISGDNGLVVVGAYATLRKGRVFLRGAGTSFWLGAFTTTAELTASAAERCSISIGDEGMFSNRITIDTTDGHSIYDVETGLRINPSKSVEIGRHVWLGREVRVSKGAIIGADSIVGQGALVTGTKCAQPNGLYAGSPAALWRAGVVWSRMQATSMDEMETSARHHQFVAKRDALIARCAVN